MPFMPFQILGIWFRGLLSIALLALGVFLLREWYTHRYVVVVQSGGQIEERGRAPDHDRVERSGRVSVPSGRLEKRRFGWNRPTAELVGGLALLVWAFAGGAISRPLLNRAGTDDPKNSRHGSVQRLKRPDGSELQVEFYGPSDGPPIVMTHGWGLDSTEWDYAKRQLADRYRLIVWDLPGLGESTRPADRDWSLEKLAADLDAVVRLAGGQPVTLLGHSIGGMIALTYCRLFPEALGERVRDLVLVNTTYTNPVKTTNMAGFYAAIQKPVLEPLLYLTIGLSPLVWLWNWMSYANGSAHRSTNRVSFSGHETRGQLDFLTRFILWAPPSVLARGMLAMFRYDATATLATIPLPTLIITGDRDKTTKPEASEHMSRTIPRATLVTLQPARHAGCIEHNERFAKVVSEFVSAVPQPSPLGTPAPLDTVR